MSIWSDRLTFDVLSDQSFSKSLDVHIKEDNPFIESMVAAVETHYNIRDRVADGFLMFNKGLVAWTLSFPFSCAHVALPHPSRRSGG